VAKARQPECGAGVSSNRPLRVGLLADSLSAPEYVRDLVAWARTTSEVDITHVILQKLPGQGTTPSPFVRVLAFARRQTLGKALSVMMWSLLNRLERYRLRRANGFADFLGRHSVEGFGLAVIEADVEVSKSGLVYRFPEPVLDEIRKAGLDVLVRTGSGILRGGILECCPFGVLSFHHGDNRVNRGGPAGFWEVFNREDSTGFVIQRLTEELDGGEVLLAGNVPTRGYFLLNRAKLYRKAGVFLQKLLFSLARQGKLPTARPSVPYFNRLYRLPSIRQQLTYLVSVYGATAWRAARRLGGTRSRWRVGYLRNPDWSKAVLHKARTLEAPAGSWVADPFIKAWDGRTCILAEEFDNRTGRAHIAAFEWREDAFHRLGRALEEPFHLSFPFLFEHRGRLFMCPEAGASRQIRIYECEEYPMRWRHVATPMTDLSAVDSMIFEYEGRWWMLTNIDSAESGDRSELHAFWTDDPVTGDWRPHQANPVLFDSRVSRNGGLLRRDGRLYRVAQRYGFDRYGSEMSIREIVAISETTFEERHVAEIKPRFSPTVTATHHFDAGDGFVVFDYLSADGR
jgi:hypothetical protein